jgi:hypothetical protein
VEITVIIVFVIAQLLVVVSTNLLLFMIRDVFHIFPAAIARWFKIEKPSTSTLAYQVWIFFIGEILLIITLGVHTSFVLTRKAKIIVLSGGTQVSQSIIQTELNALGIKNTYRDTPYS